MSENTMDDEPFSMSPVPPPTREQRANRYGGRYFSRDGQPFRVLRGATGAILHTVYPDGSRGLTDPDELEMELIKGHIAAVPASVIAPTSAFHVLYGGESRMEIVDVPYGADPIEHAKLQANGREIVNWSSSRLLAPA